MRPINQSEELMIAAGAGITWDQNTCEGSAIIAGIIVGAALGGLGGAAVGAFLGGWAGDNWCHLVVDK